MYESTYSQIKYELADAVKSAAESLKYKVDDPEGTIDFSKAFGDISCSISFRLAKASNKNPDLIAKEISAKIKKPSYIADITTEKGFINFHLDRAVFSNLVLDNMLVIKSVLPEMPEKEKRVIIEYPSVNPNKPWHIGHLRNALLGDSISNIYSIRGYDVERENYIDDLGLQMAETMWWYLNGNNKPDKKFDHWLGEEYVKVNKVLEQPDAKEGIKRTMASMSQHGTNESKLLRDIVKECIKAQNETAFAFSIYENILVWESDIVRENLLEKAMEQLNKYVFVKKPKDGDYANCIVIDLKEIKDLPEEFAGLKESMKVLIRSDGTPTYISKDIAFHMWKLGMLDNTFKYSIFLDRQPNGKALYTTSPDGKSMDFAKAKIAINIIDARQTHEQSMIKLAFKAMGKEQESNNIRHLAYGEVELESGALSGRTGTWMGYSADELLRETQNKAHERISSRFNFEKDDREKIAKSVALAAIKFEFLRLGPEKKIIFSWENALNFEGNSGPYAQYMHARATRIIEESPERHDTEIKEMPKISDQEFALVKVLSKQTHILDKALQELRPNVVTEYINELAYAFASFYESSPILRAKLEGEKAFRIRLTLAFKNTLKEMLELIGIEPLERM